MALYPEVTISFIIFGEGEKKKTYFLTLARSFVLKLTLSFQGERNSSSLAFKILGF